MVFRVFSFFMGLESSWIDFTTNDVPDIKVKYNMLISGRILGKTDKASNLLLSRQIESAAYCFQRSRLFSMDF